MKKLIVFLTVLLVAASAYPVAQSTNSVWNVTSPNGTNDLIQVDNSGNLVVAGSVTASGAISAGGAQSLTVGSLTATNATVVGTNFVFSRAATIAPTNSNLAGLPIRVGGTNYWLILVRPND